MARMTLRLDSATAEEARTFVLAFQATSDLGGVSSVSGDPTVTMMGVGWGIETPPMSLARARAMAANLNESL